MTEPKLKTRIRSDATDGAWIEGYMKGSWQVLYGTETKGDYVRVKAWLRDTAPDTAEDIIDEYECWLGTQTWPSLLRRSDETLNRWVA